MPKAFRAFNVIFEGESHKFLPGDDVPDEIADTVESAIFQPQEDEEDFLTDGNANQELVSDQTHAERVKAESGDQVTDQYSKMTVPKLVKLATDRGLEVPENPKKDTMLDILRKDDAAQ